MNTSRPRDIGALFRDREAVKAALRAGHIDAMRRHIFGNVPMVSWEDDKIVEIPPSELIKELEQLGVPLFGSPL